MTPRLISNRFPYLPLSLMIGQSTFALDALIDTGFDGDILVPRTILANLDPDIDSRWRLADGSRVSAPAYYGTLRLASIGSFPILAIALGTEPLVGRGIIDQVRLTLDHGRAVIVEP